MFNLGVPELILILVVGLVVFGPKKLPEVGRSVGKGLREFKKAMNDIKQTIDIESEFKEVADIKKEVTDIKAGLKEVVLGPDMSRDKVSAVSTQSAAAETDESESDTDVEDPRLGWVNNSKEWSMPEWISPAENEALESEAAGENQTSETEGLQTSDQDVVLSEKVQLSANQERLPEQN